LQPIQSINDVTLFAYWGMVLSKMRNGESDFGKECANKCPQSHE